MTDIHKETFDELEINGVPTLFTNGRIDRKQLPEGLFAYDIRSNGARTDFCTIEPFVRVNHTGTVITKKQFKFRNGSFSRIRDYNFTGESTTLKNWKPKNE